MYVAMRIRTSALVCAAIVATLAPSVAGIIDNVAFQWVALLNSFICAEGSPLSNSLPSQLHLAQWHALLALKATGDCTTEEAVVAFASHKIVAHYHPLAQDAIISPFLDQQLRQWKLTDRQKRLAKRIGEAVAVDVVTKRSPAGEFALGPVKDALDRNLNPNPGVFRYFNSSPEAREAAFFFFDTLPLNRPFVVPHPHQFVEDHLADVKPPKIPSQDWDKNWSGLKDVGRKDWEGRTPEMNLMANLRGGCPRVNTAECNLEQGVVAYLQSALPTSTSLLDSIVVLAKTSVAMYEAAIIQGFIKYGYWFWRPEQAYKAGDSHHAPIPTWTPFLPTPLEPEFPSGTVSVVSAGARVIQRYFGLEKVVAGAVGGSGQFYCEGYEGVDVPRRSYKSLDEFVREAQMARMYAGAHFEKSVDAGKLVGHAVADYVDKHFTQTTPSGTLPNFGYLDVLANVPKKSGEFSPVKFDV